VRPDQLLPGLSPAETQSLFRLVLRRDVPAAGEELPPAEAVLVVATDLLKGYGFAASAVLVFMGRFWTWLDGQGPGCTMLHVIDRRYAGWTVGEKSVLFDMTTGEEIPPNRAMPGFLESVAYDLGELVRRLGATARGERATIWEVEDAPAQAPRGAASGGGGGLGGPEVVRDDPGDPVP
jgi:hypothetical protein